MYVCAFLSFRRRIRNDVGLITKAQKKERGKGSNALTDIYSNGCIRRCMYTYTYIETNILSIHICIYTLSDILIHVSTRYFMFAFRLVLAHTFMERLKHKTELHQSRVLAQLVISKYIVQYLQLLHRTQHATMQQSFT